MPKRKNIAKGITIFGTKKAPKKRKIGKADTIAQHIPISKKEKTVEKRYPDNEDERLTLSMCPRSMRVIKDFMDIGNYKSISFLVRSIFLSVERQLDTYKRNRRKSSGFYVKVYFNLNKGYVHELSFNRNDKNRKRENS